MIKNRPYDNKNFAYALIFFVAVLTKYLLFGFSYYPILDDFIQYGGYPLYNDLGYVYFKIGTMATRPLAGLLDPVFWGAMWGNMRFALILISFFHFFSVLLTVKILDKCGFKISPLFFIITLFIPIGSEGAYWLSASTRLVVGMFFAILSLYLLVRYFSDKKKHFLVLFTVFHIISYGFYEPVCIFAFLGVCLIALIFRKDLKQKWWILLIPVISMLLLMLYYAWGANLGAMGSRASGFSFADIFFKIKDGMIQVARCFTKGIYKSTVKGFFAGLLVAADEGVSGGLWLVLCGVLAVWLYKAAAKTKTEKGYILFLCGLILFLAPLAPNMVVETVWIPYRTIFVSIFGFALMAEPIFTFVFRTKRMQAIVCSALLIVFLVANANEYNTYKKVNEFDTVTAQNIAEQLSDEVMRGEKNVIVIVEGAYEIGQVDLYKDHVKSVIETDWSLTGAVRAVTGNIKIKKITPERFETAKISDEQVLYLGTDGHITDITKEYVK